MIQILSRPFLALFAALVLVACGEARDDADLLRGLLRPDAPRFHSRANEVAQKRPIPPRLEVSFPSRDLSGVMLLEQKREGVATWLTADGATITTEDGLLTSAKGFGSGLSASDLKQSRQLVLNATPGTADRFHSFLNGNDEIELRAYRCKVSLAVPEDIFVQGKPTATRRVDETCYGLQQMFKNTYWLEKNQPKIVQSSQWTGDFLGNLFIKIVPL